MNVPATCRAGVVLAVALAATLVHAVEPSELNQITFQNKTGDDIQYLFLSPGDSQYWGTDVLGSTRTLKNRDEVSFYIHYPDRCNKFDIYASTSGGSAYRVFDYEICDGKKATVEFTRRNLDAEAPKFTYTTVNVRNATSYEIKYLFFSPGDSNMWGVDQLDTNTTLDPGESLSVLLPQTSGVVRYDVQAIDEDDDTYSFVVDIDPKRGEHTYSIQNSDLD